MEQAEDRHGRFGVRLEAKKALERAEVIERLVDNRKPDDCVNHIGIGVNSSEYAGEQRDAVSEREQADVHGDVA